MGCFRRLCLYVAKKSHHKILSRAHHGTCVHPQFFAIMFARRLSAAFVAPATLVLRNVALAAGEDASKPTTATTTPDNIVHQPSFGAMNTRSVPKKTNSTPRVTLDSLTLISGSAHKDLATAISKEINVPLCDATVKRFADGEVAIQINDNIRGQDVFIVQTCAAPVNDSIMELLLTISCARRSNVQRITAVVPYFGYKHHRRGNAISTKHNSRFLWSGVGDFAAMLQEMGVDRVITVDLQRPGQGLESSFFDNAVPVETLLSTDLFVHHLTNEMQLNEPVTIVAPNAECYHKARKFQTELQRKLKKEVKFVTYFSVDSGSGPTDATQLKTMGNKKVFCFLVHIALQRYALIFFFFLLFAFCSWKLEVVTSLSSMIWLTLASLFNLSLDRLRLKEHKTFTFALLTVSSPRMPLTSSIALQ